MTCGDVVLFKLPDSIVKVVPFDRQGTIFPLPDQRHGGNSRKCYMGLMNVHSQNHADLPSIPDSH